MQVPWTRQSDKRNEVNCTNIIWKCSLLFDKAELKFTTLKRSRTDGVS